MSSIAVRCALVCACAAALARPAAAADEIHWTITGQTSVTFDWRGSEKTIRFGLTPSYGQVVTATAPTPQPISSSGPFWEARLTGLQQNTLYHYSVGSGPDHTFRTPPPRGASGFTIYVEGDIGDSTHFWRVAPLQSLIAQGRPEFTLMAGDLTYANANGQPAVDRHFNDVMKWSQDAAYMPAWGNHEWLYAGDDLRNYKGRFDLPNAQTSPGSPSVSCCGEDWYWFDYGNVRFIAYPEPWTGAWADWYSKAGAIMDQAEADPAISFVVTFGHRPAYSSGHHPGDPTLREYLDALGGSHPKYLLNVNGHSHGYERTYPQNGVVHLTAATGGADLEEDPKGNCLWLGGCPPPSWSAYRAMHHVAVALRVTAAGIEGTTYCGPAGDNGANKNDVTCTQGNVLDTFTIPARAVADTIPPAAITDLR